jgi:chromosome segregation ATPase
MAVMRRDVNLGLLLLIVAAILTFSGFTVYYQTTFKNVSKSFELKLKELEFVTKDLEAKRGQLNDTSVQLLLRRQQEEDLSKKFTDVRGERDQLTSDKKKLEVELASTQGQLKGTSDQLKLTEDELNKKKKELQDKINEINLKLVEIARLSLEKGKAEADAKRNLDKAKCLAEKIDADEPTC